MNGIRTLSVVLLAAMVACGKSSPTSPSSAVVEGTVVERYTGNPISEANVCGGPSCATTDQNGHFRVPWITAGSNMSLKIIADGFTNAVITVETNSLGNVGLSPLSTDYSVSGRFRLVSAETPVIVDQLRPFTTHRTGLITLSIHADCSTDSTAEPLVLWLLPSTNAPAGPLNALAFVSLGDSVNRDAAVERVLPPGDYVAHFQAASQIRGGCPWTMNVRAPL